MNIKLIRNFAAALVISSCGNPDNTLPAATGRSTEVILPSVPDSLTSPRDRADWLNIHYWDLMDWQDTSLIADTAFIEQSFSNYVSVMPYCSEGARRQGVKRLLDASGEARAHILALAEHYLYEPESPFFCEEFYLPFVDAELERLPGNPAMEGRREDILRNRPGSPAADFTLPRGRDGRPVRLLDHGAHTGTVLLFYEPDCDQCRRVIARLAGSERLHDACRDGALRVVAVYIGDDEAQWLSYADSIPAEWEVAIDAEGLIDDSEAYIVRATPSFYLINPGDTILLKDAPASLLLNTLGL
ncbi:MAG: DUF5106 domain-containing protein [Muribaculaceae bacterium]